MKIYQPATDSQNMLQIEDILHFRIFKIRLHNYSLQAQRTVNRIWKNTSVLVKCRYGSLFFKAFSSDEDKKCIADGKKFFDLFPSFGQTKVKDPEDLHRYFWYGCDLVRQCLRPRDSKPRREKVFNPAAKWMGSFVMSMNYLFHPRIQTDVSRLRSFMENKIEISA